MTLYPKRRHRGLALRKKMFSTAELARSQRPDKEIEHPVHPLAIVRPESELVQIVLHMLAADLDMR